MQEKGAKHLQAGGGGNPSMAIVREAWNQVGRMGHKDQNLQEAQQENQWSQRLV